MNLEDYRWAHRLNHRKLGERAGVPESTMYRYCKRIRMPSPEEAARISAALGGEVSIVEILYPDGLPEGAQVSPKGDDAPTQGIRR